MSATPPLPSAPPTPPPTPTSPPPIWCYGHNGPFRPHQGNNLSDVSDNYCIDNEETKFLASHNAYFHWCTSFWLFKSTTLLLTLLCFIFLTYSLLGLFCVYLCQQFFPHKLSFFCLSPLSLSDT